MFFIIPYFSNAHFFKETLLSVIAQTDSDWRVQVLDDSIDLKQTEACRAVIKELNHPNIQYSKNEKNLGLARNWNRGLDLAQNHELTAILHADDRLMPEYVSEIKKLASRHPDATGYFCKCEVIDENGHPVFSLPDWYKSFLIPKEKEVVVRGVEGVNQLIPGNFIFCPSICYRMSKMKSKRFNTELKMVLDFEMILQVLLENGSWVGAYEKPLFQYRRHSQNQTVLLNQNLVRFNEEITLYQKLAKTLQDRGETQVAKRAASLRVTQLNLCSQVLSSFIRFNWVLTWRQCKLLWKVL